MTSPASVRWVAIALVLVGLTAHLGGYPLLDPDEGRNAEIAREMVERGDLIRPQLNGLPYVDKPFLHFATIAVAFRVVGVNEIAARLPSLVFTLGTLTVVFWFGRQLFGDAGAWTAVVATGTAPLTLGFARTVIFDATLTLFVTVALVAFYEAVERRVAGLDAWVWTTLAWLGTGAAVLTKGPIGLALPLMVAAPYAAWRHAHAAVWTPVGPLAFAALVLPWVVLVSRDVPDLVEYAIVTETFHRLTSGLGRTGPWWYFIPIVLAGTLPWSAALVSGWRFGQPMRSGLGSRDHRTVFLLLWVLLPLVFFTLSQSKRPQYVVPLVPAMALLTARAWAGGRVPGAAATSVTTIVVGAILAAAPAIVPRVLDVSPAITAALPSAALMLGGCTIAAGALLWVVRSRAATALAVLALPAAAIPVAGGRLMREIGRERSAADMATAILPLLEPEATVVAIETYPLSLPFYLRRTILVATDSGRELTSNYLATRVHRWRNAPGTTLRPRDWWRDALEECRVPVFVTRAGDRDARTALGGRVPLLIETHTHAAYGPCGRTLLARED